MRLLTSNDPVNMVRLGLDAVAAGVAFGLVVLVVFAIARIGAAGRSRPSASTADHRRGADGPQPTAASPGRGKSARPGPSQGHGQDRLRAGAPGTGGGHGGARSGRPPVLNPTNVYTPGGLLDVPRDGRAPGTPGGQFIPEILRTAGPPPAPGASAPGAPAPGARAPGAPAPGASAPGPPAGGRNQDWPSPGWAGAKPPRPGYQPGMNPGGPGRAPYAPGGQPPPLMPPRDYMRPREAPRPGHAMPPREAPRPGHVGPPRDAGLPREGMPREAMGPGGPIRPGGPVPPRDPAYQPPPGQGPHQHQGGGAGRHAGGAGYAAPGGRRPGFQGHPGPAVPAGPAGPAEAPDQFDGGYAYVIRPSDNPVRSASPVRPPSFDRPADQARPADPARSSESVRPADPARSSVSDVYVYRDTGDQPDDPAPAAPGPDEHDASYWYDLPGTSAGGDTTARVPQETRGPFEPLVSSADPPGTTPRISASLDDAEPVAPESAYSQEAPHGGRRRVPGHGARPRAQA